MVRTHVIGQRRALTSSEWTISGTVAAGMRRPCYLILHGYQGSGPGHWQTWLAGRLRAGDAVGALPRPARTPTRPQLRAWLEALDARAGRRSASRRSCICHSLACVLWLHHVAAGGRPAERVLLVAPPSRAGVPDELAPFFPVAGGRAIGNARLVCSDNDPYCPEGAGDALPRGPSTCCRGEGHINPDAGYGAWPAVEAWAREGTRAAHGAIASTSSRIAPG